MSGKKDNQRSHVHSQHTSPDDRIGDLTWWVAAFTGLLVAVGAFQAFILRRQNQTIRALERPWLVASIGPPRPAPGEAGATDAATIEFPYRVTNYGKTPTWITARRVTVARVVDRESFPPVKGYDLNPTETPLAPGKKWSGYCLHELTSEDRRALMAGDFELLLYGVVDYRDIFGDTHPCGFAWLISWRSLGMKADEWRDGYWHFIRGPHQYWTT